MSGRTSEPGPGPGGADPAIEMTIEPRKRPVGDGEVRRLLPFRKRRMVGPFIFADLMGPDHLPPEASVNIDAHPHIGLSTLTYLFAGRLIHRDSTGAVQAIEPGAVNWMTAGAGVSHTERSDPDDLAQTRDLFGLQTWVALPDESQDVEASFQHLDVASVPRERRGGSEIQVAAGTGWGLASPVPGSSPLVLAALTLVDGSPIPIEADHPERAVLSVTGDLSLNGRPLPTGDLAVLTPGATPTLAGTGTAMVLGGEPVGRRHIWWNFVHADPEVIEQAKADWTAQRFPTVPGDHDPFVPMPS